MHPCTNRCGRKTRRPGWCEVCAPARELERRKALEKRDAARKALKGWRRYYSDPRWKALSRRTLREEPVCRRCRVKRSTVADHIVPIGPPFWGAPFDRSNTQGLDAGCHTTKTAEDRAKARGMEVGR